MWLPESVPQEFIPFSDLPALCVQENGKPRFTPADLQSHLSPMFENLFLAFQKLESGENEYLMKCVMRVITFVGQEVCVTNLCLL